MNEKEITVELEAAKALGYVDHGNGTVTDTRTGLMWKQCLEGQSGADCEGTVGKFNWDTAMKIPQTLNQRGGFAGYNDWRIPTRDELEGLVMHERTNPAISTGAFPNALASYVWSCSLGTYCASDAWFIDFDSGHADLGNRRYGLGVRLVRG